MLDDTQDNLQGQRDDNMSAKGVCMHVYAYVYGYVHVHVHVHVYAYVGM